LWCEFRQRSKYRKTTAIAKPKAIRVGGILLDSALFSASIENHRCVALGGRYRAFAVHRSMTIF
jgi:hypothetical protein